MFGYVAPLKCELKVRELAQYEAYYCGLCEAIGKTYGQVPRLSLSYDCAFIALLLSGVNGGGECELKKCAYKPLRARKPVAKESEAFAFAADMNIALAYYKFKDDWRDDRKLSGALGAMALKRAANKAGKRQPQLVETIRIGIDGLLALERENCAELDAAPDAFAKLMRDTMRAAPSNERDREILCQLAYYIGKWIYLADAWEDRAKDLKSNSYNVFNAANAGDERAAFLMNCSLNEAVNAYELLELKGNKGILDNIMYEGCGDRMSKLFKASTPGASAPGASTPGASAPEPKYE